MMKKALLIMVTMAFLSTSAMAGERPEFDAVGDDSANYSNCLAEQLVVGSNPWNTNSDFTLVEKESFVAPVQLTNDLCFPEYLSAYTQMHRAAQYKYRIVLQMDPASDLDISIRDCVTQNNSTTAFGSSPEDGAFQTGRAVDFLGFPWFIEGANPTVTAIAYPGDTAVYGFDLPFYLTSRTQGALDTKDLRDLLYTSKAIWQESLVARMPEYGVTAASNAGDESMGSTEFPLSAGDIIEVTINIPYNGVTDVRYGQDNVTIKYVGVTGTVATPMIAN
jgi:hypothetical protein